MQTKYKFILVSVDSGKYDKAKIQETDDNQETFLVSFKNLKSGNSYTHKGVRTEK